MSNIVKMARDYLEANGYDEWRVIHSSILECPCGHQIEWDGKCPNGCRSPLPY